EMITVDVLRERRQLKDARAGRYGDLVRVLLAVADLLDYDIVRTTAVRTRRGLGRSPLMSTWGSYPGSKLAFQIALPM
ncbi:hypothetical protein KBZ21_43745, partial [Streptomyces sp. A73]|nr:hypothetical protein [Streptomyces sp. A73]